MKRHQHILVCVILAAVVGGCTPNLPYRQYLPISSAKEQTAADSRKGPPIDPTTAAAIENHVIGTNDFKIGFVEFDDQGWFWGHDQWAKVRSAITNEASASNSPDGLSVIVFVHGWKNNASFDNGNVETFRAVLTNLCTKLAPRKVFGVYMGWRGLSTTSDYVPPLGMESSFFNRKSASERVGHEGAATQVLTELQVIQDDHNGITNMNSGPAPYDKKDRMGLVIIGHSFGAQLVFCAISQVLTERLVRATYHNNSSNQPPRLLRSFGDLVILLSPAFEASLYNNLISLATSSDIKYSENQKPVLALFTSKGDWATKVAFPFGRFFSCLFEKVRPSAGPKETNLFNITKRPTPDQGRAIHKTVGWDEDYVSSRPMPPWSVEVPTNYVNTNYAGMGRSKPPFFSYTFYNFTNSPANASGTNLYAVSSSRVKKIGTLPDCLTSIIQSSMRKLTRAS